VNYNRAAVLSAQTLSREIWKAALENESVHLQKLNMTNGNIDTISISYDVLSRLLDEYVQWVIDNYKDVPKAVMYDREGSVTFTLNDTLTRFLDGKSFKQIVFVRRKNIYD
jgi:hypothetical protein